MKKPLRSIIDYLFLTIIVSVAILLILLFNGSKYIQQVIVLSLSILYIVWGMIHHLKQNTFQARIILEYVLFALIGSILVIGLLK
jgi:c-di-AMP phosphodiesterase-like protein